MADVTVNVRGNAASGGGGAAGGGGGSMVPSNERMIEDVRREMQQRGILLVPGSSSQISQLIDKYVSTSKTAINENITSRYDVRREDIRQRAGAEYAAIETEVERKRQERYAGLSPQAASDPLRRSLIEQELEQYRQRQYKKIGQKYDEEESKLDQAEKSEKDQAETELAAAMKELVAYFKRHEDDQVGEGSYIGGLRAQQKELIQQRDAATTEEGAIDASRKLADVNEKLRKAMGGGGPGGRGNMGFDPLLLGTQGVENLLSSLQSGDVGGAITGGTSAVTGLLGAGMKTAMRANAIAAIVAGGYNIMKKQGQAWEGLGGLAALRVTGSPSAKVLNEALGSSSYKGLTTEDWGLSTTDFAEEAARRSRTRGTGAGWYENTIQQIGLERGLGLSRGALESGGKYDIYGKNITDAISQLVTTLSNIKGSGVLYGDFTRVQEKYDIQQQIMGSYMGRSNKPDYDVANSMLAAFSSVKGITQDSRIGGEIQSFQDMIQNPKNERMKSLVYGTVADLLPETGGRIDLIDRAIRDPQNEGKIIQAVVQRLTQTFGGTDTQTGYFAFKELFPNIAPERLDEFISQISSGDSDVSKLLKNGIEGKYKNIDEAAEKNKDKWISESTSYVSAISKFETSITNLLSQILNKMPGPKPATPQPKPGGNN